MRIFASANEKEGTLSPFLLRETIMKDLAERLGSLVEKEFESEGVFLVECKVLPGNVVKVYADKDTNINIDECARISRYLETAIEREGWLGDKYTLEVSSPGLSRPFKVMRQYRKRLGKGIEILLKDGRKITGKLIELHEDHILVDVLPEPQKGKNKKKPVSPSKTEEIRFSVIKTAKPSIAFKY